MKSNKNNPILRFDANLNCGQVTQIADDICREHVEQMTVTLVDKYISLNHADHISANKVVYNRLLQVVKNILSVNKRKADAIYVSVINADYDIRCGNGNGKYI